MKERELHKDYKREEIGGKVAEEAKIKGKKEVYVK